MLLGNIYYVEDGIIRREPYPYLPPRCARSEELGKAEDAFRAELAEHGYHPKLIHMKSFLDPLVGKTWEDLVRKAEQRAARSIRIKQAQIPRDVEIKQWEDLRMRFNNTIIGIEKRYINIHPSGFSIRVLMKSDSKENRKRYAEEHRAELLSWCMEELNNCPGIMRRIGKPDFYTPVKIAVLQSNELEIYFEVKEKDKDKENRDSTVLRMNRYPNP